MYQVGNGHFIAKMMHSTHTTNVHVGSYIMKRVNTGAQNIYTQSVN